MNYLLIAISAYLLNAISVLIDKILLVKKLPNPALYVFYISLFSLLVLVLSPITPLPNFLGFALASFSTILWTLGAYFMFRALKNGEAARVIPIIGTLIPIILLLMSSVSGSVNSNEVWATIILLIGLIFLIIPSLKGKFSKEELILEIVSALLFANSYFVLKLAYTHSSFLSVFVYSRVILIPIILAILVLPVLRKKIFTSNTHISTPSIWSKVGLMLFIGQAAGGTSQLLLTFAISLAEPAVINSIQGIQYVFLFLLSLILARKFPQAFSEKLGYLSYVGKIAGIIFIFFGLWMLSFGSQTLKPSQFGVTFSPRYSEELNLKPTEVLNALLTDLKPGIIRLPVYWDEVEKTPGVYNFTHADNYLNQIQNTNSKVILSLGFKQPRWPECFQPEWASKLQDKEFDQSLLKLIEKEIEHFKKYPSIKYWQIENEPFLDFGICPKPNYQRLLEEIKIVKSNDNRPVLLTDSGELSTWYPVMKLTDVFGSTVYRTVWSPTFGLLQYPWPPVFYNIKGSLIKFLAGSLGKPMMIVELQTEPWPDDRKKLIQIPIQDQMKLFPPDQFLKNAEYAHQTGFDPIILWGGEWWYFMKQNGIDIYWQTAQKIFNP